MGATQASLGEHNQMRSVAANNLGATRLHNPMRSAAAGNLQGESNNSSIEAWIVAQCRGLGPFCSDMCSDYHQTESSMDINVKGRTMDSPLGLDNSIPLVAKELAGPAFYTRGPQSYQEGPPPEDQEDERQNLVPVPQTDFSPYATIAPQCQASSPENGVETLAPRTEPATQQLQDRCPQTRVLAAGTAPYFHDQGSSAGMLTGPPQPPQRQQRQEQEIPTRGRLPSFGGQCYCVSCNAALSEGANFCKKCGTEQPGGRHRFLSSAGSTDWQLSSAPQFSSRAPQTTPSVASGPSGAPVRTQPLQAHTTAAPMMTVPLGPNLQAHTTAAPMMTVPLGPNPGQSPEPFRTVVGAAAFRTQPLHATYANQHLSELPPPVQSPEAFPTMVGSVRTQLLGAQEPATVPMLTRPLGMLTPPIETRGC